MTEDRMIPPEAAPMREDVTQEATAVDISFARRLCTAAEVWPGMEGVRAMAKLIAADRLAHTARPDAGDEVRMPIPVWDVREVEDCGHRGMKGYEVLLPDGTWTDVAAHNPEDAIATANLDWRAGQKADAGDEVERARAAAEAWLIPSNADGTGEMVKPRDHCVWGYEQGYATAMREGVDRGMVERDGKAIYIAARFSRRPEANALANALQRQGYRITSRWVKPETDHVLPTGSSEQAADAERERFALEDMDDVRACDCMISLMEEPRSNGRGGRHVEYGAAVALGKKLVVIGPRETVFHHLPGVAHFDDVEGYLAALSRKGG